MRATKICWLLKKQANDISNTDLQKAGLKNPEQGAFRTAINSSTTRIRTIPKRFYSGKLDLK